MLGLIFLKYADSRFTAAEKNLGTGSGRRKIGKADYQAQGVMYLPEEARFGKLLELPEGTDLGTAINDAMEAIEKENDDLAGVLPRTYKALSTETLTTLLRNVNSILGDIDGDGFGKDLRILPRQVRDGRRPKGGQFFTPTSIVKLIVEIIEPFKGKILDPACGSGGMFVQTPGSSKNTDLGATDRLSIHGTERVAETVKLCRMNLAVHGLGGQVKQANSYYEDPQHRRQL